MKSAIQFLALASVMLVLFGSCQTEKPWQPLFNGQDISNFDTYLGSALNGFDSLAQEATAEKVFSVVDDQGTKLIRISGEVNGSLATRDTFSNYHLQLIYKWGDEVYTSRNSGLLYHSFGEFGEALGTWMVNIECQLMHERLGDTYLMNNTYCEVPVEQVDDAWHFAPEGEMTPFSKEHNGQLIKKAADAENPLGEWNTVDLYCYGQTAVHVINGQTVMVNYNTGKVDDGKIIPLSSGKIQIQSEGGEMFIKSLQVKPIDEIPAEIMPENQKE